MPNKFKPPLSFSNDELVNTPVFTSKEGKQVFFSVQTPGLALNEFSFPGASLDEAVSPAPDGKSNDGYLSPRPETETTNILDANINKSPVSASDMSENEKIGNDPSCASNVQTHSNKYLEMSSFRSKFTTQPQTSCEVPGTSESVIRPSLNCSQSARRDSNIEFINEEPSSVFFDDDGDDAPVAPGKKTKGKVKIKMEFINNKARRLTTFSKRKHGIMKKAYELSVLTGTQVLLLVASETGHVYTYATEQLQPMISSDEGQCLIHSCLNVPQQHDTMGKPVYFGPTTTKKAKLTSNVPAEQPVPISSSTSSSSSSCRPHSTFPTITVSLSSSSSGNDSTQCACPTQPLAPLPPVVSTGQQVVFPSPSVVVSVAHLLPQHQPVAFSSESLGVPRLQDDFQHTARDETAAQTLLSIMNQVKPKLEPSGESYLPEMPPLKYKDSFHQSSMETIANLATMGFQSPHNLVPLPHPSQADFAGRKRPPPLSIASDQSSSKIDAHSL